MGVSRICLVTPPLAEVQKERENHEQKPQPQSAGGARPKNASTAWGGDGDGRKAWRNQTPQTQGAWWDTDRENLPKLGPAAPGQGPVFSEKLTIGTNGGPSYRDGR